MVKKKVIGKFTTRNLHNNKVSPRQRSNHACRNIICEVQKFSFGTRWTRTIMHTAFVSMPPTVLKENLISRYKSLVSSLHVEPIKDAEVGSFERKKETDFSVDSTTKTNIQTKNKIKSQERSAEKNKAAKKKLAPSKGIRTFFTTNNVQKSNDYTSKTEK